MPMAAVPVTPSDRFPMPIPMQTSSAAYPETYARDAIIAWFRGEFAAANAIIDALCTHLTQLDGITGSDGGGGSDYESVFAAIHQRRLNWIPVIQMQKFFSIADVALELRKVAAKKIKRAEEEEMRSVEMTTKACLKEEETVEGIEEVDVDTAESQNYVNELKEESKECVENGVIENGDRESLKEESGGTDSSSDHKAINGGLEEVQHPSEDTRICLNHEDCESRRTQIKMTKGFIAKEPVKGHMVNVVKGLKLYEDIFTESELSKLTDYINELHLAGRNGELSGETFALFNQQLKGNKRELIQLGVPIFGQAKEDGKYNIEPIPSVIQTIIDHLVQWHLIPESRRPNSCIINFFDEGESSQPYLKPPHLDQPISSLFLSESEMAFGRVLVSDNHGNYKGPLMLTIKEGSLLVMRGNSADMARHVMCPSPNKRISLTFCKVRPVGNQVQPSTNIAPMTKAVTLWQSGLPQPYRMPNGGAMNGAFKGYDCMEVIPKWGVLHHPLVMLDPMQPMPMSPRRLPRGGTGVFLPWNIGSKKHMKHLPPRAQRGRLLALPSPAEPQVIEPASDPSV